MKRRDERAKVTEVAQEKDQDQLHKQAMRRKQRRLYLRGVIEEGLYYCRHLFNIDPKLLSDRDNPFSIFPSVPYQKGNLARDFIQAVKNNKIEQVEMLLKEDPMLVYEYDDMKQTGLIWAAKRNYSDLAELLVHARSRINFKDIVGRTALMLAVENRNERLMRFLLCFHANPITRNYNGKGAIDLAED